MIHSGILPIRCIQLKFRLGTDHAAMPKISSRHCSQHGPVRSASSPMRSGGESANLALAESAVIARWRSNKQARRPRCFARSSGVTQRPMFAELWVDHSPRRQ